VIAAIAVSLSGDQDAKIMVQQQPMKMAAAEALYETATPAPFSVFTIGTLDGSNRSSVSTSRNALSFLATGTFDGTVQGINNLQAQYRAGVRPAGLDSYTPYIPRDLLGIPVDDRVRHARRAVRGARLVGLAQGS
jgi:cytochrome d ubiquinol oxidase subunit I